MRDYMKSLGRAIDLLLTFETHSQLSVEEMAKIVSLPRSSVYRFVRVLRERGLLSLEPATKNYRLGPAFYQLAKMSGPDPCQLACPQLEMLVAESGETSFLSLRSGWEARYAACVESSERIHFTAPLGRAVPLYAGASAKAILAYMEEEEREMYLRSVRLKRLCTATIQDKGKLKQKLLQIRNRGYDLTQEELYRGAWGLAAPILDDDGVVVASIAITGVKFRMPGRKLPRFISLVRQAAQEISDKLRNANFGEVRKTGS